MLTRLHRQCRCAALGPSAQRGLTLVELMVGITIGLFVVAAATMLVTTQLGDNRRLLLETQIQQDLRAAADIITRQLRRAGRWQAAQQALWMPGAPAVVNPYSAVDPASAPASEVRIAYRSPTGENGPFGFRRAGGVLQTSLAGAGWQALTDEKTLRITRFSVTPRNGDALPLSCPILCADDTTACWPTLRVRELVVEIDGEAVADPAVKRSLRTVVRLRNDLIERDPALAGLACPS